MTTLTRPEVRGILSALGHALAGELEPSWGRNSRAVMESAHGKLCVAGGLWLDVTRAEARAALGAIGQMTDGNGRDYREWRLQTHRSHAEWRTLLYIEQKLQALLND